MRNGWILIGLALLLVGCRVGNLRTDGPKVKPEPDAWRRKALPLPPLYMSFTSGSGNRWTMVTPLYWQVKGTDKASYLLFPLWYHSRDEQSSVTLAGPLYHSERKTGDERSRTLLFPWLYSRETDNTGYDYWGIFFRLIGVEKQIIDNQQRTRLWLFFVFPIPLD